MKVGLKRELNFWTATIYGIGIILGAGVYSLIGGATGLAGNSVWLSFVFAGVVSAFTGLSYMELISLFPQTAAEYIYVKNAFKNRMLAFNVGWMEIFADVIATSAVALGFAGYFHALFGTPLLLSAFALIFFMSLVNFCGISESSRVNMLFSIIEVCGLVFVILLALAFGHYGSVNYLEMPNGIGGVLGGAALIFFAYIGFEELANMGDETKKPRKNLPKALMAAVVITTVIYILIGAAVVSLVDWRELAMSKAPLALAVSAVLGEKAFWLISVIALFATANTVLVGMIVGSRMMYGMSRDGSLPKILSKVHRKRQTPWVAVIVTMLLSMTFISFGQIDIVASITDLGTFYIFAFVNAAAILLRYRMPRAKRTFRAPLNIGRFPLVPFFGLISSLILASQLSFEAILIGLSVALLGVFAYVVHEHNVKHSRIRILK